MNQPKVDLFLSLFGMVFAAAYSWAAAGIPKSMLSDEVGPGGVPLAIGLTLLTVCFLLFLKSSFAIRKTQASRLAQAGNEKFNLDVQSDTARKHQRALLLFGLLVSYIVVAPFLGYVLSVTALFFISTTLAGERSKPRILVFSIVGAIALFLIFEVVMGVAMPKGLLGI